VSNSPSLGRAPAQAAVCQEACPAAERVPAHLISKGIVRGRHLDEDLVLGACRLPHCASRTSRRLLPHGRRHLVIDGDAPPRVSTMAGKGKKPARLPAPYPSPSGPQRSTGRFLATAAKALGRLVTTGRVPGQAATAEADAQRTTTTGTASGRGARRRGQSAAATATPARLAVEDLPTGPVTRAAARRHRTALMGFPAVAVTSTTTSATRTVPNMIGVITRAAAARLRRAAEVTKDRDGVGSDGRVPTVSAEDAPKAPHASPSGRAIISGAARRDRRARSRGQAALAGGGRHPAAARGSSAAGRSDPELRALAQSATPLSPKAADPQLNRSALRRDPPARSGRTPSPQEEKPTATNRALPPDVAARLKIVADFHARARAAAAVFKAEPPPAVAAVISAAIVQPQEPAAAAARTSMSQAAGPSIAVSVKMDTLPFAADQMASDTSCEQMLPAAGACDVTAASRPPAPPTARSASLSPVAPDPITPAVARYLTTPITGGPDGVGAPEWSGMGDT